MSDERKQKLQKQLEFYLSDANLRRDQFFQAELKKNAFVPLTVFLNCNMVKKITKDPKVVANAVEGSKKIVLNEEKNAIARVDHQTFSLDALLQSTNYDSLFVCNLPLDSTLSALQGGNYDLFPEDSYVKFNDQVTSRKWILPHAFVDFASSAELETFLAKESVEVLPDPCEEFKLDSSISYALKSLEIDSYVEKGKNLFKINPDAFAHIYLKDNLKKDYEGLKKNVEEMLKSVAKPVKVFQHSRHVYVEFENKEALENVFDLYVKQRKLKYPSKLDNPRFEKLDPVLAVLLSQFVHVYGYPAESALAQKRKSESPEKGSPKKKTKAVEADDE